MVSNRKSLTQSIRARISRSRSSQTISVDGQPTPPLLRSASTSAIDASTLSHTPPPFPCPRKYAACYCEENVYHLVSHLSTQLRGSPWHLHTVFISNPAKTVLLYNQSASKLPTDGWPVIWDYHVVAVATLYGQSWIYDYDSVLTDTTPIEWRVYWSSTFRHGTSETLKPMFRCLKAGDYLDWFASDRSHMRTAEGWITSPPSWQPIQGQQARKTGVKHNLVSHYVDVTLTDTGERYGTVWRGEDWFKLSSIPLDQDAVVETSLSPELKLKGEGTGREKLDMKRQMDDRGDRHGFKGGRIASPLFPAYLHASQQKRVELSPPSTPVSSTFVSGIM